MSGLTNPSPATNLKFDASNNVLANINAQAIKPNINNPYLPSLLSHQTGLSASISTANSPVNIGAAITIPRNGIMKITISGHISADTGFVSIVLTRGSNIFYFSSGQSSTVLSVSLFSTVANLGIVNTTILPLTLSGNLGSASNGASLVEFKLEMPVLASDSVQFVAGNNTASTTTYVDDLVVVLQ